MNSNDKNKRITDRLKPLHQKRKQVISFPRILFSYCNFNTVLQTLYLRRCRDTYDVTINFMVVAKVGVKDTKFAGTADLKHSIFK